MHRCESIFDIDPSVQDEITEGIKSEGSNLCGISVNCSWKEINKISMYKIYFSVFYYSIVLL